MKLVFLCKCNLKLFEYIFTDFSGGHQQTHPLRSHHSGYEQRVLPNHAGKPVLPGDGAAERHRSSEGRGKNRLSEVLSFRDRIN